MPIRPNALNYYCVSGYVDNAYCYCICSLLYVYVLVCSSFTVEGFLCICMHICLLYIGSLLKNTCATVKMVKQYYKFI